jgi:SAM-dependent methyltransferase
MDQRESDPAAPLNGNFMNRLHAVLPAGSKKYIWDIKYGFLGYPRFVCPDDVVHYLSDQMSAISSILDLGCGRGSLLRALRAQSWPGTYCGVDISRKPIEEAKAMNDQGSSWVISDFESFCSALHWDLIAMVESIYYVRLNAIPAFLGRMMEILTAQGALLFRVHDGEKHRDYLDAVLSLYPQTRKVDEHLFLIGHDGTPAIDRPLSLMPAAN